MISRFLRVLNVIMVLAALQACSQAPAAPALGLGATNPATTSLPATNPATTNPVVTNPATTSLPVTNLATATSVPFVAETAGPAGFSASLAAPDLVLLKWEAAPDAVGYKLQMVISGMDPLTIAYLPKDATRFEHYLAPESSLLTYRLQTLTASGPAGASSLQITTQAHTPNPLTAQAVFSETGIASAVIGPAGGTLETTDARGVTYTLVVPPQAIDADLKITMTPVSTIGGWPLDGKFLGAVKLEPEGWLLNEVASLTIRLPAAPKPGPLTTGFAFNGSGEEFHLAPANAGLSPQASLVSSGGRMYSPARQQNAGVFNLPVIQLRTSGIGATSADSAAALAGKNAPTNSSDAGDQKAAVTAAVEDELAPLWTNAQTAEVITGNLLTQIHFEVKDCYDFKRAAAGFHAWEADIARLGDPSSYSNLREGIMNELAEKAVETIEKATQECLAAEPGVVPASIPCAEKLTRDIQTAQANPGSNSFYSELGDAIAKDAALQDRFTAADPNHTSVQCPHSFGVNSNASLGYSWTSACIPSLDRPYQVAWKGANLNGEWRMYPSGPFGGRLEGQSHVDLGGGATQTNVYTGTYKIEITQKDDRGYPQLMDAGLTYDAVTTMCTGDVCTTFPDNGTDTVPLIVNSQRCPLP